VPEEREAAPPPAPDAAHPLLALQVTAGNAATSRLLARQPAPVDVGGVCVLDEEEGREEPVSRAPALTPDQAKKVAYARTTLARVPAMRKEDEASLRTLLPGIVIMDLVSARNGSRGILRDKTAALEKAAYGATEPDEQGNLVDHGTAPLEAEVTFWTDELTRDQAALDAALASVGVRSESEFQEMVEDTFPDLFLRRATQVALTMLDENERLVRAEGERMGVNLEPGEMYGMPWGPGEAGAVAGMRAAAAELAALQLDAATQHIEPGPPLDDAANARALEDEGYDWQTMEGQQPPRLPSNHEEIQRDAEERRRRVDVRQQELGLKYPLLLRTTAFGHIAQMSDDELNAYAGNELVQLLQNISDTRENITDGDLEVWHLRNVFDVTLQDLGITAESPFYAAVERRVDEEERDERIWKIAVAAISLTAGLIGAFATAGGSLAMAGSAVAVLTGTYQLAQSVGEFYMEKAGSDVALDPALADISTGAPDMVSVALDLVGLGLDSYDVIRMVQAVAAPIRAARASGELAGLSKTLAAIPEIGEAGAERIVRTVSRDAAVSKGVSEAVGRIGNRLRSAEIKGIEDELKRLGDEALQKGFDDLKVSGHVRPLNEEALQEVYSLDEVEQIITNEKLLRAGGFYDRGNGYLFVKGGDVHGLSHVVVHEVTHYLQNLFRPSMSKFMREFEAFAAQRHYLQRLVAEGIDPNVAFADWKWLVTATDEDLARHITQAYGVAPPAVIDYQQAVMDAIGAVGRIELPSPAAVSKAAAPPPPPVAPTAPAPGGTLPGVGPVGPAGRR
jgi:hypothetical protein